MRLPSLFVNTVHVLGNEYDPDLSNNTSVVITEVYRERSGKTCVIVPKIFSSCQWKECFPNVTLDLTQSGLSLISMKFGNGQLSNHSITALADRPDYARVVFSIIIPVTLILRKSDNTLVTLTRYIPKFYKDTILCCPQMRSELTCKLYIETQSDILTPPMIDEKNLIISVGTCLRVSLAEQVQLQIESFGYCPETGVCEEFFDTSVCEEFVGPNITFFPNNLYPS